MNDLMLHGKKAAGWSGRIVVGWAMLFLVFWVVPSVFADSNVQSAISVLREGDIIFQESFSAQSKAIRLATRFPWSHCGLVLRKKNRLMVFEAAARTQYTPLETWIALGVGKRWMALRLRDSAALTREQVKGMRRVADLLVGRPYDRFFEWSDKAQYCSELVWKVYRRGAGITLCPLRKLGDFDLDHPVVRTTLRQRFGNDIPRGEAVVAPSDLAVGRLLVLVGKS